MSYERIIVDNLIDLIEPKPIVASALPASDLDRLEEIAVANCSSPHTEVREKAEKLLKAIDGARNV